MGAGFGPVSGIASRRNAAPLSLATGIIYEMPQDTEINLVDPNGNTFVIMAFVSSASMNTELRASLEGIGMISSRLPGNHIPLSSVPAEDADDAPPEGVEGVLWESDEPVLQPGMDLSRLQANALSLEHLCTHEPKNDHCPECLRSKAQNR